MVEKSAIGLFPVPQCLKNSQSGWSMEAWMVSKVILVSEKRAADSVPEEFSNLWTSTLEPTE